VIGCLSEPYLPSFSAKLYEIMNVKYDEESSVLLGIIHKSNPEFILNLVKVNHEINHPKPLFIEITEEDCKKFKNKYG